MLHVSRIIQRKERYVLMNEQGIAFDVVKAMVEKTPQDRKAVVLVEGGPGTGKSAIALQLLADFMAQGKDAQYATGSQSFNETLWEILGDVSRPVIRYFHQYARMAGQLDVLILDEAHRIRETSNLRWTPQKLRSRKSQLQEILDAARVCVFFVDSAQVVRPDEVGSPENIVAEAQRMGAEVRRISLDSQFRCGGSDTFVNWVDNTLAVRRTTTGLWEGDEVFDFQIVPTVEELESKVQGKLAQGFTARMTAGYCWNWSKRTQPDGSLVEDVVVGDWRRPWNARPGLVGLKKGIPPSYHWAYDPNGASQVGCIYTAQGFEFDYAGVIWGPDLRYDWDAMDWVGDRSKSFDTKVKPNAAKFLGNVKNTYRVLLTRGLKGCYVHFLDKDTERFVRSRLAKPTQS